MKRAWQIGDLVSIYRMGIGEIDDSWITKDGQKVFHVKFHDGGASRFANELRPLTFSEFCWHRLPSGQRMVGKESAVKMIVIPIGSLISIGLGIVAGLHVGLWGWVFTAVPVLVLTMSYRGLRRNWKNLQM